MLFQGVNNSSVTFLASHSVQFCQKRITISNFGIDFTEFREVPELISESVILISYTKESPRTNFELDSTDSEKGIEPCPSLPTGVFLKSESVPVVLVLFLAINYIGTVLTV